MHTLSRQIRFSIDPFSDKQEMGRNSYASKPCGDGVGLYLALWVDLSSNLNPDTGFVVNVSQIDQVVRQHVVPLFTDSIQGVYRNQQSLTLVSLVRLLKQSWAVIQEVFGLQLIQQLRLDVNPNTQISIQSGEANMFIYSEKFEFAAMHKLWNDAFDQAANNEMFGRCANPGGHGHNYIIEVQVQCQCDLSQAGWKSDYQRVVKEKFLDLVDHKNLNTDVPEFKSLNPTVENLSLFAWQRLDGKVKNAKLFAVTVWENDRTFCSYKGI